MLIVANAADETATVELDVGELDGRYLTAEPWSRRLADAPELRVEGGRVTVTIAARDGTVYRAG
jgi:hypothetical protein